MMITGENRGLQIHLFYNSVNATGETVHAFRNARLDAAYCLDAPDCFPAGSYQQWRFDKEYLPIETVTFREEA